MRLSSVLMRALESFNQMDPEARAGFMPVNDGIEFCRRAIDQSPAAPNAAMKRNELVGSAGNLAGRTKVDPYLFSAPDMHLS